MGSAGIGTPYWYEWEIGLFKCIEMLWNMDIESVIFQAAEFDSIDDVVVNYVDGSTLNIQVKHTDADNNFTFSTLLDGETSMLVKWAKDWQKNKSTHTIKAINIVTNKCFGPNKSKECCSFKTFANDVLPLWKNDLNYVFKVQENNEAIKRIKNNLSFLGDDLFDFIKILNFVEEKDLNELETEFHKLLSRALGTTNTNIITSVANNLHASLIIWTTSLRTKEEVDREEVYKAICSNQINNSEIPDFYSLYPEKPIFPSREKFKNTFIELIKNSKSKIIFLKGLPGSGKTNFVTYLSKSDDSIIDFNFYTYIPVKRSEMFFSNDAGYYSGAYLWRCLLYQLKNKFETLNLLYELQFPLTYGYMNITEMRSTVLKFLGIYAERTNKTCFVFIDGLDHAARSRETANETFLSQLPTTEEILGNVKFVLVGQPLNDKYPSWLINENNKLEVIDLPSLSIDDVVLLLSDRCSQLPDVDLNNLSKKIIEVVGNNALNILFAMEELKDEEYGFDKLIEDLCNKKLNCEISRYYEWILNSCKQDLLLSKILTVFSFITQKISLSDIATLCSCSKLDAEYALSSLFPLIQNEKNFYYVFHNDVRLYFKNKIIQTSYFASIVSSFKQIINARDSLSYLKYYFLFDACYELNDDSIFDVFTSEYIIRSVLYNVQIAKLSEEFMLVFELVYKKQLTDKLIPLSLCFNTLFQYVNCAKYNASIDNHFQDYLQELVRSEKYYLNSEQEFENIVVDIHFLTQLELYERGEKLFKEYLDNLNINWLIDLFTSSDKINLLKKFGFICRFFNTGYIQTAELKETQHYCEFVSGWLEASKKFTTIDELKTTFLFAHYYENDLFEFIKFTVAKFDLAALKGLSHLFQKDTCSILILIEICCGLILRGEIDKQLVNLILTRKDELKKERLLKYKDNRISYFIKLYFCVYSQMSQDDKNQLFEFYKELLDARNIKIGDRGYAPAIAQFEIAHDIFDAFNNLKPTENTIEHLYDLAYFSERYGTGSINDSNSYEVMPFLNMVIFKLYELQDDKESINYACNRLLPLYIGTKPKFISEFLPLFSSSKETEYLLAITNFWASDSGYVWQESYSSVESICDAIINELIKADLIDEANKIDEVKRMKIVGYVDHKDYSLYDVLEWFECVPIGEEKFKLGIELLSISEEASSIGDNRASGSINESLFQLAFHLGVKYVDALFDIKNVPKEFYYWREYLLTELKESLNYISYSDEDLLEIHRLLNSWINIQIENGKRYGHNQSGFWAAFNNAIAGKFKDHSLRKKFLKKYPTPKDEFEQSTAVSIDKDENSKREISILEMIRNQGLSEQVIDLIKKCIDTDDTRTYHYLLKFGKEVCSQDRKNYVDDIVVPYIIEKNTYGLSGSGFNNVIDEYKNEISIENYFKLLRHSIKRLQNNDTDVYYSVNDDINTLVLNFIKAHKIIDFISVFKEKIETHKLWITACGLLKFNSYNVNFDTNINSLVDFNKKYLN